MKTVVAAALGEYVHVAAVMKYIRLAAPGFYFFLLVVLSTFITSGSLTRDVWGQISFRF